MNIDITLHNEVETDHEPSLEQFQQWVAAALENEEKKPPQQHVAIRLVSEIESAALNETYRQQSGPTNILSFPDEPIPGFESESLGDLAICPALVMAEALAQDKPFEAHWAHLVVHGVLHLIGYDHIEQEDAEKMEAREVKVLKQLHFDDPYQ